MLVAVSLIIGNSNAIFFTRTTNNDLPRLGRRGVYLTDRPSYEHYGTSHLDSLDNKESSNQDIFLEVQDDDRSDEKRRETLREFFTTGNMGYRRMGRQKSKLTVANMPSCNDLMSMDIPWKLKADGEVLVDTPQRLLFVDLMTVFV